MSGDRLEFDDGSGVGRLTGTLHDPLATPGDVLTVQPDHSIAAAPGGGSMPGAQRWIGPHTVFANLLQTVDMTGDPPDGGTFTLVYDGEETAPIAWDATKQDVAAALSALPSLSGPMMVNVSGPTFQDPASFPTDVMQVVLVNTPARPLALSIGDNSLTASSLPVADPVVGFDASFPAWYCVADLLEGDLVVDTFVAQIVTLLGTEKIGFYNSNGDFLFPGQAYIPVGMSGASTNYPDFTYNSNAPMTAQMTDATAYGQIPTLALTDADLFVQLFDRGGDDSAGEYRLYLAVATPAALS